MSVASVLNPHSPEAQAIYGLFGWVLVMSALIFAMVALPLAYIAIRYRASVRPPQPAQVQGNIKLEIAWTVVPLLALVALFIYMAGVMVATTPSRDASQPGADQPDLVITGHQWWWEARYPASGVITAGEIHIPAGKRMLARIESADVIHDFWVPSLGPKIDAVPGHPNYLWLQADTAGEYSGACSEYCGAQHAWMRFDVIAQPVEEFERWQEQQSQRAAAPAEPEESRGARLFQDLTCANCHRIAGTAAQGDVGPDLTHVGSRATLGSGILTKNPQNMRAWLRNPQAVKPGVHMPDFKLDESQVNALAAYLESLK